MKNIMMFRAICTVAVMVSLLSGCQTFKKFQCDQRNWQKIGYQDGEEGKVATLAFDEHNSKCVEVGTTADRTAYLKGHSEGISLFCTVENGRREALGGAVNDGVCPATLAGDFDAGYEDGLDSLCTVDGALLFGRNAGEYKGTCEGREEEPFLTNYMQGLSDAIIPAQRDESDARAELTVVRATLSNLDLQVAQYDSAISNAKRNENSSLLKSYEDLRSSLRSEKFRLEADERSAESKLEKSKKKLDAINEMLAKWSAYLGS